MTSYTRTDTPIKKRFHKIPNSTENIGEKKKIKKKNKMGDYLRVYLFPEANHQNHVLM